MAARTKSPAFQWYPQDYLADINVQVMTIEQEGVYRRLLDYCWLQGSISADPAQLAASVKLTPKRLAELWPGIVVCFRKSSRDATRLIHPRLERERRKQRAFWRQRSEAGKKGNVERWGKHRAKRRIGGHRERDAPAIAERVAKRSPSDSFAIAKHRSSSSSSKDLKSNSKSALVVSKKPSTRRRTVDKSKAQGKVQEGNGNPTWTQYHEEIFSRATRLLGEGFVTKNQLKALVREQADLMNGILRDLEAEKREQGVESPEAFFIALAKERGVLAP